MQPRQRERRRNVEVQAMIEAKLKWVDDIFNPLCEGADKVANARAVVAKKLGKTLEIGTKKPEPPMSERIASAISTRLENLAATLRWRGCPEAAKDMIKQVAGATLLVLVGPLYQ
jgi:hypothetical protein